MSVWEQLRLGRPDIAEIADFLRGRLDEIPTYPPETLEVEFDVDRGSAAIMGDVGTPPHGVFAVGAWADSNFGLVPALFVNQGLAAPGGTLVAQTALASLLRGVDQGALNRTIAVPVPPAQRHFGCTPGSGITIGSRVATVGVAVQDRATGAVGFLTAAHAAPTSRAVVRDSAGQALGHVERTCAEAPLSTTNPGVDVAFVEAACASATVPTLAVRAALAPESVTFASSQGPRPTFIRGTSQSWWIDPNDPPWDEVSLTAVAVSQQGDSGGPVYAQDGSAVGHIVGGLGNAYSVVQDLNTQLSTIGADIY